MEMKQQCFWRSVGAGALGGLTASFVMNQFQSLLSKAQKALSRGNDDTERSSEGGGEDATVKTAEAIAHIVFGCELSDADKKWAGPAVHYAFGTSMGALYGALSEKLPVVSAGRGTAFGTALWLGADEIAVPATGLSGPATESPLSSHASALAAHLAYGLTTDLVRQFVLRDDH